jgi:hypothetical protein
MSENNKWEQPGKTVITLDLKRDMPEKEYEDYIERFSLIFGPN